MRNEDHRSAVLSLPSVDLKREVSFHTSVSIGDFISDMNSQFSKTVPAIKVFPKPVGKATSVFCVKQLLTISY